MANVICRIDMSEYDKMVEEANEYFEEEQRQAETLSQSSSLKWVLWAKKYDDLFLDPIVGFFLPGVGDFISSMVVMPALYVSLFKLRSIRLFLAVIEVTVLDLILGFTPVVGDIVDAFYKSNKIAARLIDGYVRNDEETMHEINKRSAWALVMVAVLVLVIIGIYKLIASFC